MGRQANLKAGWKKAIGDTDGRNRSWNGCWGREKGDSLKNMGLVGGDTSL